MAANQNGADDDADEREDHFLHESSFSYNRNDSDKND